MGRVGGGDSQHCSDSQGEASLSSSEQVSTGRICALNSGAAPCHPEVMQPQAWQWLVSFSVFRQGRDVRTPRLIHYCPAHRIPRVSGPDKAWVTPTAYSVRPAFLPSGSPSFTHQGHAPRCPRIWGGSAPSKKEGRWPVVLGSTGFEVYNCCPKGAQGIGSLFVGQWDGGYRKLPPAASVPCFRGP